MKKMLNSQIMGFILLLFFVSLVACKQDLTIPTPVTAESDSYKEQKIEKLDLQGVKVEDGMLVFESNESMANIRELLSKSNFKSYKAWCESKGFKSLAVLKDDILSLIENTKSDEEIESIINKNTDIFEIRNDEVYFKNEMTSLLQILNRESMFKIGNTLYRYDNKGEIIVLDGDLMKMRQAVIDRKENQNVRVFSNDILQVRSCTASDPNFVSRETGWINGDNGRRANVYFRLQKLIVQETYLTSNVTVTLNVETKASKRSFRVWHDYTTEQTLNLNSPNGIQTSVMSPYPVAWGIGPTITDINYFKSEEARDVGFSRDVFTVKGIYDSQLNRNSTIKMNFIDCIYSNRGGVNIDFHCN